MAKLKITNRYGVIPNELLNDDTISFKAKGLFAFIQSKPEEWDFSIQRISKQTKESETSITTGIKELEKYGYLTREYSRNLKGHIEVEYVLNQIPCLKNPTLENPTLENPTLENPTLENSYHISKQEISKQEISKQEIELSAKISCEIFAPAFEIYSKFFKNKNEGIPPKINSIDGKAMKSLINYFKKILKEKNIAEKKEILNIKEEKEEVLKIFNYIFKNWNKLEPFLQNQIKLNQIDSNINSIINQLKNGIAKPITTTNYNQANTNELVAILQNRGINR